MAGPAAGERRSEGALHAGWACAVLVGLAGVCCWAGGEGITWHPGWRAALEAADKSGRPALVYLRVPGSIPCQNMEGYTLRDKAVVRLSSQFECAGINAQTNPDFAQKVLAREILEKHNRLEAANILAGAAPTIFFFNSGGEEMYRVSGFVSAPDLVARMHLLLRLNEAQQAIRRDPTDAGAQAKAGHLYLELDVPDASEGYLHDALQQDRENKQGTVPGAKVDLAIIALKREKLDQAIELLHGVLSEYPQSEPVCEARYYLGVALLGQNRRREALEILAELGDYPPGRAHDKRCANSKWAAHARGLIERLEKQGSREK